MKIGRSISTAIAAHAVLTVSVHGWDASGNFVIGAYKLDTGYVTMQLRDINSFEIRDQADENFKNIWLGGVVFHDDLTFNADALAIKAPNVDANYVTLQARDTEVGRVEVARLQGATDPQFKIGNNGNAIKGTYAGLVAFHDVTPCDKAAAYTQTYSTADRTVANPTATTLVYNPTEGGWGGVSEAEATNLKNAVNALIADNLNLRKIVTALIDDLQEVGLVG